MHGGISPKLNKLSDLAKIKIPLDITTEDSSQLDLLWADPSGDVQTFEKNVPRGCSKLFSVQDVYATCERLNFKSLCVHISLSIVDLDSLLERDCLLCLGLWTMQLRVVMPVFYICNWKRLWTRKANQLENLNSKLI
ncbi:unnamed protein product [Meloidogyne enterolobii]|uniref:Uncharacterized protein n=1 Tax=Meloidogyne enterolobii TaxID=390850 RepID=A0ACB1AF32_MELEN